MPVSLSGAPSHGTSTPLHLEVVSTDPHLVPAKKGTYEVGASQRTSLYFAVKAEE